jgi:hypothetical protein
MFFGLVFLIVVLGSVWLGLVALAIALGYWNKAPIRYVGIALFVLSFIAALLLWSSDANESDEAEAWYGEYAIRDCSFGSPLDQFWKGAVLKFEEDQVCSLKISATDSAVVTGTWNYVNSEDLDFIEVEFPGHGQNQIFGIREQFRSNRPLPIKGCR